MADARFDGQPSSGATPLDNAILTAALRGIAIQSIIFLELCIDINGGVGHLALRTGVALASRRTVSKSLRRRSGNDRQQGGENEHAGKDRFPLAYLGRKLRDKGVLVAVGEPDKGNLLSFGPCLSLNDETGISFWYIEVH